MDDCKQNKIKFVSAENKLLTLTILEDRVSVFQPVEESINADRFLILHCEFCAFDRY